MKKYWCKACPKCHGDLALEQDIHGWFVQCMQCGLLKEIPAPARKPAAASPAEVQPVAATHRTRAA